MLISCPGYVRYISSFTRRVRRSQCRDGGESVSSAGGGTCSVVVHRRGQRRVGTAARGAPTSRSSTCSSTRRKRPREAPRVLLLQGARPASARASRPRPRPGVRRTPGITAAAAAPGAPITVMPGVGTTLHRPRATAHRTLPYSSTFAPVTSGESRVFLAPWSASSVAPLTRWFTRWTP